MCTAYVWKTDLRRASGMPPSRLLPCSAGACAELCGAGKGRVVALREGQAGARQACHAFAARPPRRVSALLRVMLVIYARQSRVALIPWQYAMNERI